jgi:hypothetical protein
VTSLIKTAVLWLMLLALPLQGFAASAMACCDPQMQAQGRTGMQSTGGGTDASPVGDDVDESMDDMDSTQAPMSMSMHHVHASADGDAAMEPTAAAHAAVPAAGALETRHAPTATAPADHHHGPASPACASCAAHCAGMAPMPIASTVAGHLAPNSNAIPFRPTASTAFVPGTPERPPQPLPV